jgi:UPF0755 protein
MTTILAAVQPEETPYYFFRARCDGSGTHVFSVTYEEHLIMHVLKTSEEE